MLREKITVWSKGKDMAGVGAPHGWPSGMDQSPNVAPPQKEQTIYTVCCH